MTIRKNISLKEKDYNVILEYATKNGFTFSEFIRNTALDYIKNDDELTLLEFINNNIEEISEEEQKEIDALNIDFDDINGRELTLNDIL